MEDGERGGILCVHESCDGGKGSWGPSSLVRADEGLLLQLNGVSCAVGVSHGGFCLAGAQLGHAGAQVGQEQGA